MTTSTQPRSDVYSRVTAKIIADLEQGVRTWQRPWNLNHKGNSPSPRRNFWFAAHRAGSAHTARCAQQTPFQPSFPTARPLPCA